MSGFIDIHCTGCTYRTDAWSGLFDPRDAGGKEYAELQAAIDRVTIQSAECTHEAWEWPMTRCPACGLEGR